MQILVLIIKIVSVGRGAEGGQMYMNAVTYPLAGPFIGQQPHRATAECLPLPLGREDAQLLALLVAQRVAVTHLQQRS